MNRMMHSVDYNNIDVCIQEIIELDKVDENIMMYHLCRFVNYNKDDIEGLDKLLESVDVLEASTQMIISTLRFTFSIRSKLQYWNCFLIKSALVLDRRNLNTKSLLRGLL